MKSWNYRNSIENVKYFNKYNFKIKKKIIRHLHTSDSRICQSNRSTLIITIHTWSSFVERCCWSKETSDHARLCTKSVNQGMRDDKKQVRGFPGGAVVENLPASAGDTGSSPGLGRSHMPWSNWAREPQLLSLRVWSLCSATWEAAIVRGPRTAMKSGPHLPQLEKALAQKRRPNTAINK